MRLPLALLFFAGVFSTVSPVAAKVGFGITGAAKTRVEKLVNRAKAVPALKINTAGWSDSPFISRDGRRLYFMYSRWDFGPYFLGGSPILRGPERPGLHKDTINPFDESDIYVATRRADGSWNPAVNLGFNGAGGDASGMELDDGDVFVWIKPTAPSGQPDIYMAQRDSQGVWGPRLNLGAPVNTTGLEDNPHLSPDGAGLWFTSDRPGGLGGKDIWFSQNSSGVWSSPVNLGAPVNTAGDEDQFWVSPAGGEAYFTRDNQIYRSTWTGAAFLPPVHVPLGQAIVAEPSVTDDGQWLYVAAADPITAHVSIMVSRLQMDGGWGPAQPVD